jgi:hypothetical protein
MYLTAVLIAACVAEAVVLARQDSSNACAEVSQLYFNSVSSGTYFTSTEGAQLAQDCLNSIPFNQNLAQGFLDEVNKVIPFHSTLETLANPPSTYKGKAVDVLGGLDKIASKVNASDYTSYYEFETEFQTLIQSVNDAHLRISTCTTTFFSFGLGNYSLLSVSSDGTKVPDLYLVTASGDIFPNTSQPSPVTKINGQGPSDYLQPVVDVQFVQDPDAQYQLLFPEWGTVGPSGDYNPTAFGSMGQFNTRNFWPGNMTTVEFADGSTYNVPTSWSAAFGSPFTSAENLFQASCLPSSSATSSNSTSTGNERRQAAGADSYGSPPGYPSPILRDPYNTFAGYYLDDEVAVMVYSTFSSPSVAGDYASYLVGNLSAQFVEAATSSGHTKLIIDISSNPGGSTTRGFDLFRLFFPQGSIWWETRLRRSTQSEILSKALGGLTDYATEVINGPMTWKAQVTPDQENGFASWEDFIGNETYVSTPRVLQHWHLATMPHLSQ